MSRPLYVIDHGPLVREDHLQWFAKMSAREQLAYMAYSMRYGVATDHLSDKLLEVCKGDAERIIYYIDRDQAERDATSGEHANSTAGEPAEPSNVTRLPQRERPPHA